MGTPELGCDDRTSDASRYYTFEYVVQPDGSRDFETTVVED